jgi:hypothetical protein
VLYTILIIAAFAYSRVGTRSITPRSKYCLSAVTGLVYSYCPGINMVKKKGCDLLFFYYTMSLTQTQGVPVVCPLGPVEDVSVGLSERTGAYHD